MCRGDVLSIVRCADWLNYFLFNGSQAKVTSVIRHAKHERYAAGLDHCRA